MSNLEKVKEITKRLAINFSDGYGQQEIDDALLLAAVPLLDGGMSEQELTDTLQGILDAVAACCNEDYED